MKLLAILVATGALLAMGAVLGEDERDESDLLTAAQVIRPDDYRMKLALDCLTHIRESKANEGDTVLVKLLDATGFELRKVSVREFKDNSGRVRFGFEFGNGQELKSVYWESDCPQGDAAGRLAAR